MSTIWNSLQLHYSRGDAIFSWQNKILYLRTADKEFKAQLNRVQHKE